MALVDGGALFRQNFFFPFFNDDCGVSTLDLFTEGVRHGHHRQLLFYYERSLWFRNTDIHVGTRVHT